MVTRQPSFSSPTRLATGHPHLVEEHLGELGGPGERAQRPYGDARRVHGHREPGDAAVLRARPGRCAPAARTSRRPRRARSRSWSRSPRSRRRRARARVRSAARSEPASGSLKPWHQTSLAAQDGRQPARPLLRRCPRRRWSGPACSRPTKFGAHVGRARRLGLLQEDQVLGGRGAPAARVGGPVQARVPGVVQHALPAEVVGAPARPVVGVGLRRAARGATLREPRPQPRPELLLFGRVREIHEPLTFGDGPGRGPGRASGWRCRASACRRSRRRAPSHGRGRPPWCAGRSSRRAGSRSRRWRCRGRPRRATATPCLSRKKQQKICR